MKLAGWGNYPHIDANKTAPASRQGVADAIKAPTIARGQGRSYGDSALSPEVISTENLDRFIRFDTETGVLESEAGVTLGQILELTVPKGWFLPVTPGTKFVSLGGAIAADVHGKNHHHDGCFSQAVLNLTLQIDRERQLNCSVDENADLFRATCGGMGLTGVILSASIQLKPIESAWIKQRTIRTHNLSETLEQFERHQKATYSVAWIDCLAGGESLGRSLIMLGEHASKSELGNKLSEQFKTHSDPKLTVPLFTPAHLMNKWSIKAFNELYYRLAGRSDVEQLVHYDPYFYPLDAIGGWNKLYGKAGFVQYQFVIPLSAGVQGLKEILEEISLSGKGSFLAVLKVFGESNQNPLSFPMAGYTLALDFKVEPELFELLDRLDQKVLSLGGRNYLAKDARMSEDFFKTTYQERVAAFQAIRANYGVIDTFNSQQAYRLGIQKRDS